MTIRVTPYRRLRYPCVDSVVDVNDLAKMVNDIDAALLSDDKARTDALRMPGASVYTFSTTSLTKNINTTLSFDTVNYNNGASGGFGTANWWAASPSPTRMTAPYACLVLAYGYAPLNITSSLGTNGFYTLGIYKNGSVVAPNFVTNKIQGPAAGTGLARNSVFGMMALNAGDYLELRALWNGTPAGPMSTDIPSSFGVQMLGVP